MSHHQALIAKLQRNGRWIVQGSAHAIEMTRQFGKKSEKVVTVVLEKESDGMYILAPINYAFRSTTSHFDYCGEEQRWARNKNYIKSLVSTLKQVEAWDMIRNKDTFIQINTNNPKANKAILKDQFSKLIKEK